MRRMVSFIMLPIYTRFLTPEHYGTLELLSMVLDITAIVFGLRIGEAVFRFYFDYDDRKNRDEVISTSLILVGGLNALGVAILLAAAGPLSEFVLGSREASGQLALFSFTLIFQSITEMVLVYVRAQQRPWVFVGFSTLKLALQLSLNIYFVVVLRMAVDGVIYSALISSVVVTVPLLWYTLSQTGLRFSLPKARSLASFSAPLVLTSLVSFYMTFGDRYFLRVFGGGLDEVGVYALGYRFGFLLSFIVGDPFYSIWNTEKYVAARQPNAHARFRSAFLLLTSALLLVTVGISVYVRDVLRIMASPEFWGAYLIVPIVLVVYVFQNWTSFVNMGVLLHNRTGEIARGTILAAILITVGYFALIPPFGGVGAAIATAVAFGGRMAWIGWRAHRLYPLDLPWGRAASMVGLSAAAWGLSLLAPEPIVWSLAVNTGIVAAYTLTLVFAPGFLPPDLRETIRAAVFRRGASLREIVARPRAPGAGEPTGERGDDAGPRPEEAAPTTREAAP